MRTIVEPGDVFVDADGLAWVGNISPSGESDFASFVFFTAASKGFTPTKLVEWLEEMSLAHPESDANTVVAIEVLQQPFTLIAELKSWEG